MIEANRIGLKQIANLTVDAGFAQKLGHAIYLYEGEITEPYKILHRKFYEAVQALIENLLQIESSLLVDGCSLSESSEKFAETGKA